MVYSYNIPMEKKPKQPPVQGEASKAEEGKLPFPSLDKMDGLLADMGEDAQIEEPDDLMLAQASEEIRSRT